MLESITERTDNLIDDTNLLEDGDYPVDTYDWDEDPEDRFEDYCNYRMNQAAQERK